MSVLKSSITRPKVLGKQNVQNGLSNHHHHAPTKFICSIRVRYLILSNEIKVSINQSICQSVCPSVCLFVIVSLSVGLVYLFPITSLYTVGHKNWTLLIGTITLQIMSYCNNFWHKDARENFLFPSSVCLIFFVKLKTENQLIRFEAAFDWILCIEFRTVKTLGQQRWHFYVTFYLLFCYKFIQVNAFNNWPTRPQLD